MIKCYFGRKYEYYAAANKKRDEKANLTFTHDEELTLMLAKKMHNFLILNEEKVTVNFLAN